MIEKYDQKVDKSKVLETVEVEEEEYKEYKLIKETWERINTYEEFNALPAEMQDKVVSYFCSYLHDVYNTKNDRKIIDKLMSKAKAIFSQSRYTHFRNQTWAFNQSIIQDAITDHIPEFGTMPSTYEIQHTTILSRFTISKHLKDFIGHPLQEEEMERFQFMTSRLLAKMLKMGINGDTRAAKV